MSVTGKSSAVYSSWNQQKIFNDPCSLNLSNSFGSCPMPINWSKTWRTRKGSHLIKCFTGAQHGKRCLAWIPTSLPTKISTDFMCQPLLCRLCAATEVAELKSAPMTPKKLSISAKFLSPFNFDSIQWSVWRDNVLIFGVKEGVDKNVYQKSLTWMLRLVLSCGGSISSRVIGCLIKKTKDGEGCLIFVRFFRRRRETGLLSNN